MKPFTVPQITVIQALATGATITAAAQLAGISRPTIYSWFDNPAFQQAVAYAQQEYAITMRDRMQALAAKALDRLEGLLDNPKSSPSVILKASLAILQAQRWNLPGPSIAEAHQAIADAAARMEADADAMRHEAEYATQLTDLYTKSPSGPAAPQPTPKAA